MTLEQQRNIERYLAGEMNAGQQADFEQQLLINASLRHDLELHREVNAVLSDGDLLAFGQKLRAAAEVYEKEEAKTPSKVKRDRRWVRLAAAAVFVGGMVVAANLWFFPPASGEKLVERYLEPYEAHIQQRNPDSGIQESLFSQGLKAYEAESYPEAIAFFQEELADNDFSNVHFYLGVSQLFTQQYNEAEKQLSKVVQDKNELFLAQAKWYLVLALLGQEKMEEAQHLLNEMVESQNLYQLEAARKLLKDLE